MPNRLLLLLIIAIICARPLLAEKAETLEEAKSLSVQVGKPILMEFAHDD